MLSTLYAMPSMDFVLETLHGPDEHQLVLHGAKTLTIGRGKENNLPLPKGATVSRQHAQFTHYESGSLEFWKIQDLGSRHGTFLNGVKLRTEREVRLRAGDLITIEPYTFQLIDKKQIQDYSDKIN